MKSISKRSISVLLAALMALALMVPGFAAAKNQTFDRNTIGTQKMITGYNPGSDEGTSLRLEKNLKATEKVDGKYKTVEYTFIGVADNAFNVESATVNNVTKTYLATVKELTVEDGIKTIGASAFANMANLEKVTFLGDVELAEEAFASCPKLKEVTFDGNATVGTRAFSGCASLEKIVFGGDVDFKAGALDYILNLKDLVFSDDGLVTGFNNLKNSNYVKKYPVDFIMQGSRLVYYKGNDEVITIPYNVTEIGPSAFEGNTNLRTINITKYVDTLGDRAFYGCENLSNVNFATFGSIEHIGKDVFTGTAYYNNFDGDFFTIGTVLIKYRGKSDVVTIPNTITKIAEDCFMGSYASKTPDGYTWVVSTIFVPASVEEVAKNSFALAQLDDGSYYIPKLYAYDGTTAMAELQSKGYAVTTMPALADVDGNGVVETEDARLTLRMAVGLDFSTDPKYAHAADVDGDGKITSADARRVLRLAIWLEKYTPQDLLYMPMTKLEILMAYAQAMDMAVAYNAGYTKTTSNKIEKSDMCPAASSLFYSTLGKKGASNKTETFTEKTDKALENFDVCTLMSDKNIESASCVLDEKGKYTISIKFKDVADNTGSSDIVKIFPAKTRDYFASSYTDKSYWNSDKESNKLTKFDLTYTGCSLKAVIVRKTNKVESVDMTVGYHFALDGRVSGLAISSAMWKTGDATLDRVEETKYSQFIFSPNLNEMG